MSKQISLNNGRSYMDAAEAIQEIEDRNMWDALTEIMDDDTREAVAAKLAPCSRLDFLARYLELAPEDLILG